MHLSCLKLIYIYYLYFHLFYLLFPLVFTTCLQLLLLNTSKNIAVVTNSLWDVLLVYGSNMREKIS